MFCTLELKRKMAIKSTETTLGVSAVPGALLALACSLLFKPFRLQQRGAYRVPLLLFPLRFPCWAFPWMERLSDPTMLRFHITNCYSILLLRGLLSCLALIAFFFPKKYAVCSEEGLCWARANSAWLWKPQEICWAELADPIVLQGPSPGEAGGGNCSCLIFIIPKRKQTVKALSHHLSLTFCPDTRSSQITTNAKHTF